jgi:hypothetical protein
VHCLSPIAVMSSLREHPSGLTNGGCYFFGMPGPHECARLRIANPAVRRRHRGRGERPYPYRPRRPRA